MSDEKTSNEDKDNKPTSSISAEDLERIARAVDTDRNLSDFFINSIIYQVEKNMDRRTKLRMYYTRVSAVVFFAVLAPSAWFGVQNLVSTAVSAKLKQQSSDTMQVLTQRVDNSLANAQKQLALSSQQKFDSLEREIQAETLHLSLISGVIYLDISTEYLQEDIRILVNNFEKAKKFPELQNKRDFPIILDKAVSAFIRFNALNQLDKLESWFPNIIANNPITVSRLVVFYGEQLVGSVYPPDRWAPADVAHFQTYLQLARGYNQYVRYLPMDILVEYRRGGQVANSVVDALVASIAKLTPDQQLDALTTLIKYSDTRFWQKTSDSTSARMAAVVTQFLKTYKTQLLAIASTPEVKSVMQTKLQTSTRHVKLHEAMSQFYLP